MVVRTCRRRAVGRGSNINEACRVVEHMCPETDAADRLKGSEVHVPCLWWWRVVQLVGIVTWVQSDGRYYSGNGSRWVDI